MACKDCIHEDLCMDKFKKQYPSYANKNITVDDCEHFKDKADFVEVCRCRDCIHAVELDKHCELNRFAYKHCVMWKGEEEKNVWHKYKKCYKDYSIVEPDDFCSYGERAVNYESSKTDTERG